MELKGTKTEQNLLAAFAGESQARNKYSYFASKAKKDGYEQIAAIFEETANNEKEHAKMWFKLLEGGAIKSTPENLAAAAGGETPRGLHGFGGWVVRRLGGTEEATRAHLDALFSRLIANAENPYSPEGLAAGLPDWCRLKGRTPWTRDPVGSAIAAAYLRHAAVAAAVAPTLRLELRAARLAIALRLWKDAHGAYPETLAELAAGEKPALEAADFADPFAPDGAPLRYARDGDGWRFWSVGLDRADGGGVRDAFTAPEGADLCESDLVFTSHERAIRRAALDAAGAR